jgi:hypothetical protein
MCVALLKAKLDEDMTKVDCSHCGFSSSYDSYLETMKGIAQNMSDDFQASVNKSGF